MGTLQQHGMQETKKQAKWNTINPIKGQSSSKEDDVVYMVGLEGRALLWVPSQEV